MDRAAVLELPLNHVKYVDQGESVADRTTAPVELAVADLHVEPTPQAQVEPPCGLSINSAHNSPCPKLSKFSHVIHTNISTHTAVCAGFHRQSSDADATVRSTPVLDLCFTVLWQHSVSRRGSTPRDYAGFEGMPL